METNKDILKSDKDSKEAEVIQNEEVGVVIVPDGGWGWVIVFASFMCNVIVDGIIFSFGLFIPEFAEAFGEPKGKLAWIGSIMAGFYLIIGPIVSGFANAYGCRIVTIAGTIIATASLAVSSLANSMEFLCVSFGLLGGIGFGFIFLPAVVTVGFYFEKKRALATGLAVCGSGVGTFVMAPLVKYLLQKYGWKGTLLILAGIVLHCAVFGALFKPLHPNTKKKKGTRTSVTENVKDIRNVEKKPWQSNEHLERFKRGQGDLSSSLPEVCKISGGLVMEFDRGYLENPENSSPAGSDSSPPPPYSEIVGEYDRMSFLSVERNGKPAIKRHSHTFDRMPRYDFDKKKLSLPGEIYLRPFYRKDILYSRSILNLPDVCSERDIIDYHKKSSIQIPESTEKSDYCCCSPVVKETFRQMMDLTLLRSPTFLVLALAGFVTLAGFFVPFVFVIDRAVTAGVSPEEATYILSAIGFTNTVGRVFSGWVSDRPNLNALTINNVALIIGGLGTIISPFLNSFTLLMIYGAMFGFSIACFATLRSIIVVELLGLDKLTNAFGLLLLFQGIAAILGGPVAGMFYDMTGSYNASFYIAGSFILASGLLGIPLPAISRYEKRRNARRNQQNTITITVEECELGASKREEV